MEVYNKMLEQYFPNTSHTIPVIKSKKLTEIHKKHISEALKKKYDTEDYDELFEKFIKENINSIKASVYKYLPYLENKGKDKEDITQEALLYVYENLDKYNPKFAPSTWIKNFVGQEMYWQTMPESLNTQEFKKMSVIRKAKNHLASELKREPTIDEISNATKIPVELINKIVINSSDLLSLDAQKRIGSDDGMLIGDAIGVDSGLDEMIDNFSLKETIEDALSKLNENERYILLNSSGFETGITMNNAEMARELNMSRVRVGVILNNAIDKMKNYLKDLEKSLNEDYINFINSSYLNYINKLEQVLNKKNTLESIREVMKSVSGALDKKIYNIQKSKEFIRIRQRDPKIFNKKTMRTVDISKSLSIKAVIGELPNDSKTRIQTLLFNKNSKFGKSWNLKDAKNWVKSNKEKIKISIDLKDLLNKCKEIV
jgi:RNA polymerase sigma factor (sigma-70 family)